MTKIMRWTSGVCALLLGLALASEGASLHQLPIQWRNDRNEKVQFSAWRGKPVILTMAYTSCHGSCPLIIQKLRKIEKALLPKYPELSIVVVTLDPQADTPQALHAYRERMKLNDAHWSFLTGSVQDVRRLSLVLGLNFSKPPGSTEIMHDNRIAWLAPSGEIIAQMKSLDDPETLFLK